MWFEFVTFQGKASENERYEEIAQLMNCFKPECQDQFMKSPLHQIWRDHLLAGIHRLVDPFEDGFFVFLYPKANTYCSRAAASYNQCLTSVETFAAWTLEDVISTIRNHTSDQWIDNFYGRYLDFNKLDRM